MAFELDGRWSVENGGSKGGVQGLGLSHWDDKLPFPKWRGHGGAGGLLLSAT